VRRLNRRSDPGCGGAGNFASAILSDAGFEDLFRQSTTIPFAGLPWPGREANPGKVISEFETVAGPARCNP